MRRAPGAANGSLRQAFAALRLGASLLLASLLLGACGLTAGTTPAASDSAATATTTDVNVTATIMDTGDTTSSTTPPSVPALPDGITPEQVADLVAQTSNLSPSDWEVRECETLGDWAVAELHTDRFPEQMDERGVAAVFEKSGNAWFFKGWVSLSHPSEEPIELANMNAPAEVWSYFGLDPVSVGELVPPDRMPADFGFVAAYGVMGRNVIDTREGTFTKDLGLTEGQATTKLSLSRRTLETLYQGLLSMQLQWQTFSTAFAPDPDPANTGTTTYTSTYYTYRLEWQAGDFRPLDIVWEDSALSADLKAVALREWFEQLRQLIEATPEWQALPPMTGGYV